MKNLGHLHYCLILDVWQYKDQLILTQAKYVVKILKKFKMEGWKPISTLMDPCVKLRVDDPSKDVDATLYHKLIGRLIYLCNTYPNLCAMK